MVPLAGIEPALLAELDFEFERVYQFRHRGIRVSGPRSRGRRSGRNIAGGRRRVNPRGCDFAPASTALVAAGYEASHDRSVDPGERPT